MSDMKLKSNITFNETARIGPVARVDHGLRFGHHPDGAIQKRAPYPTTGDREYRCRLSVSSKSS